MKNFIWEKENYLWFMLCLIIGLTLFPFFKVGITTADDLEYYMRYLAGNVMEDARGYAQAAGRFYFLITKPIYLFPYIFDSFLITKIIQYGSLLLSSILFGYVVKKIFKSNELALLSFLLFFAILTITPNYHIPIIAYPFYFSFSFSIFLFSILRLIKYTETDKYKYLIQSSILFAAALLLYETYLIFLLFIGIFILIRNIIKYGKAVFKTKLFYKEILPFIIVGVLYLLIYFAYRLSIPADKFYGGSSFAENFSITGFFKIIINYNKAVLPLYTYNTYEYIIRSNSLLEGGHSPAFGAILLNSSAATIVNALLQCYIFIFLFLRLKQGISWKKIGLSAIIATVFMFSSHLLIAVSEKYNNSWWTNVSGYVTTYFSYFAIILIFSLIVYSLFKLTNKYKWLKYTALCISTLVLFYVSILTGYTNEHLSRDWERSQNRFRVMNQLCYKGVFDQIPDNTLIFAPDLYETYSLAGHDIFVQNFNWSDYVQLKTGKRYHIYKDPNEFKSLLENGSPEYIYYISKFETGKSMDILYVFSKVNKNSIDLSDPEKLFVNATTNDADVHYYSKFKSFDFHLYIPGNEENPIVKVNNNEPAEVMNGYNNLIISSNNVTEKITSFRVNSTEPFSVMNFRISNIGYTSPDEPVYISY